MSEHAKRCPRCGESKVASEFWKNKGARDGLCSYCKDCMRDYHKDRERKPTAKKPKANEVERLRETTRTALSLQRIPPGRKFDQAFREIIDRA